jgi:hypothetical protein
MFYTNKLIVYSNLFLREEKTYDVENVFIFLYWLTIFLLIHDNFTTVIQSFGHDQSKPVKWLV